MYLYWGLMVAFHNSQFSQYGGTAVLAAYAILGYVVTFYYLTVEGIANGMQPLASYNFGAKQFGNIRKLLMIAMFLSVILGIIVIALLHLFPGEIVNIFNRDGDQVRGYVLQGISLHLFALFLDGFLVVCAAYYQSINSGKKAMFITLGNIIIQPPFLFLLPKWFGLTGVWLAFPLSNITIALFVGWMLFKDVRRVLT
jgi:Na+-driven multidrug efflux pump